MKRVLKFSLVYFKRLDKLLILLCLGACFFSAYMLYSMVSNEVSPFVHSRHYKMQIGMGLAGLSAALIVAVVNYKYIAKFWFIGAAAGVLLMLLLHTPLGVGPQGSEEINWLDFGFTTIQPSEFLKFFYVITYSAHLAKAGKRMNQIPHLMLLAAHTAVPCLLLLSRGDFGTTLVVLLITFTMLFIAGLWWRYVAAILALVPVVAFVMWNYIFKNYHRLRILVLIDEEVQEAEMLGFYHQQHRSLIAIGSGELTGRGLFGGEYIYIPEYQTDFIFSYIGMTLGFAGTVATLCLIMFILIRILSNCLIAKDILGKYMCVGVFAMFLYNTIINVGMTLAVMPVIGQPLPLIGAGGSAVLAYFMGIGLVLSVRAHKDKKHHMFYTEKD
ncbi:MAG: FtsW/RodA/SpoVE family cell cycle protein [Oscillospiraceae bacterium]|jgi:rod shape determining protein RodA|nr:FtsW/RodA/SpoVE family cell cycle protein [Oscillospiraceae bacterium]